MLRFDMTDDLGDAVDSRNSLPQCYASEPAIHFAYAKKIRYKSQIINCQLLLMKSSSKNNFYAEEEEGRVRSCYMTNKCHFLLDLPFSRQTSILPCPLL